MVVLPGEEGEMEAKNLAKPLASTNEIALVIQDGQTINHLMYPGINLNVPDINGNPLIANAIDAQNHSALIILLEHGADPNFFLNINQIPFLNALENKDFQSAEILLSTDKLNIYDYIKGSLWGSLIEDLTHKFQYAQYAQDASKLHKLDRLWTIIENRADTDIDFKLNSDQDIERLAKLVSALILIEKNDKVKKILEKVPSDSKERLKQVFTSNAFALPAIPTIAGNNELIKLLGNYDIKIENIGSVERREEETPPSKLEVPTNSGLKAAIIKNNHVLITQILDRNPKFTDSVAKITNLINIAINEDFDSCNPSASEYLLTKFQDHLSNKVFYPILLNLLKRRLDYDDEDILKIQLSTLKRIYDKLDLEKLSPEQAQRIKLAIIKSRNFGLFDELNIVIDPNEKFHTKDKRGWTLTHFIFDQGIDFFRDVDLKHFDFGFEVTNQEREGLTPVEKYFNKHSKELNLNALTDENETPLHIAARNCNFKTTRFLILKGVDPTIRNTKGQTALDILPIYRGQLTQFPEPYKYLLEFLTDFFSIKIGGK